jgi:imidazolonepropionase-like amidohydrolase
LDWRFDGLTALVSIAAGKAADLVVLAGNRAKNIDDVERVETVFKDASATTPRS